MQNLHTKECFFKCDNCDFKYRGMSKYEGHLRRHMQEQSKDEDDTEYTQRVTVVYKQTVDSVGIT